MDPLLTIFLCSFKRDMWETVASELFMPWRAVEAMHWQMGVEDINARANERVFQSHPASNPTLSTAPRASLSNGATYEADTTSDSDASSTVVGERFYEVDGMSK